MILVLSAVYDNSIRIVTDKLSSRGVPYDVLYPESIPDNFRCTYAIQDDLTPSVQLRSIRGESISCNEVNAVWYWHPKPPNLSDPSMDEEMGDFCDEEWYWFVHALWRIMPCYWLNHPRHIREAEYKPLQLKLARELGFQIPDTLITNDPLEIGRFYTKHQGHIIQKTVKSQIVVNRAGKHIGFYTEPIERHHLRDQRALAICPSIYQENIKKQYDIRITVVGKHVFPAEIHSQRSEISKQDFRHYDLANTPYYIHKLPKQIKEKCLALLRSMHLDYGALDLILTPDGRYLFLEINPSGQFGWIEVLTGMPISASICSLLLENSHF